MHICRSVGQINVEQVIFNLKQIIVPFKFWMSLTREPPCVNITNNYYHNHNVTNTELKFNNAFILEYKIWGEGCGVGVGCGCGVGWGWSGVLSGVWSGVGCGVRWGVEWGGVGCGEVWEWAVSCLESKV